MIYKRLVKKVISKLLVVDSFDVITKDVENLRKNIRKII